MIEEGSYNMNEKENDEKFLGEFLEGMDKKDEKMCVCGKEMIEKGGFYECPDGNYCARKKPVEDQSSVFDERWPYIIIIITISLIITIGYAFQPQETVWISFLSSFTTSGIIFYLPYYNKKSTQLKKKWRGIFLPRPILFALFLSAFNTCILYVIGFLIGFYVNPLSLGWGVAFGLTGILYFEMLRISSKEKRK
jgi:hypothetical protein